MGDRTVRGFVLRGLTIAIQVVLGVAAIVFGLQAQSGKMALMVLAVALSAVPQVLTRVLGLHIHAAVGFVTATFIFLAMFLGTSLRFYDRYWWWDLALHAASGFLLGIVGLIVLYLLDRSPSGLRQTAPGFVAVFALTFASTLGVVWEVFEYVGDTLVPGSNMQLSQSGVQDTMMDLIMNLVGAAAASILIYRQSRGSRGGFPLNAAMSFVDDSK